MNESITGIKVDGHTHNIAAFAVDILLFLTNPKTTISTLLKEFEQYKYLSNLQINFSKSYALIITLPSTEVTDCKAEFPLSWKTQSINYLGIQLPSSLDDFYQLNYIPILKNIQQDLLNWHGLVGLL